MWYCFCSRRAYSCIFLDMEFVRYSSIGPCLVQHKPDLGRKIDYQGKLIFSVRWYLVLCGRSRQSNFVACCPLTIKYAVIGFKTVSISRPWATNFGLFINMSYNTHSSITQIMLHHIIFQVHNASTNLKSYERWKWLEYEWIPIVLRLKSL